MKLFNMDEKTQKLLDRTFWFGVNTLKFLRQLPDDYIYKIPKLQVSRSSSSIGANYEEAQGAVSKRDFINKIGTCYKESRESHYRYRVHHELYPEPVYKAEFEKYIQEALELKKIFSTIKKSSS
jgi:four helix bundle protein